MAQLSSRITLESTDGQRFQLSREVARLSSLLEPFADSGTDEPIQLPNVNAETLALVVEFCEHQTLDSLSHSDADEVNEASSSSTNNEWNQNFVERLPLDNVFEILLAANYLQINILLDTACKRIANMTQSKSSEDLKRIFNIKNDVEPDSN